MASTLARLDPDNTAAVDRLIEAVRAGGGGRPVAVSSLGNLGPRAKRAVPELIPLLHDPDFDLPTQTAYALGKIGPAAEPFRLRQRQGTLRH
jgi:HEAT repeat protein